VTYDEAWDMPTINWQQQGSFEIPELPPTTEPDEGPFVCLPQFNRYWLPYVMGALDQLRNPSSWLVADDAAMYATLARVTKLREMLGVGTPCMSYQLRFNNCVLQYSTDGGTTWIDVDGWDGFCPCVQDCVTPIGVPPSYPGGPTGDDLSCSIAEYLVEIVLQGAISAQIANVASNNTLLALGQDVATLLAGVGFIYSALFVEAVDLLYGAMQGELLTDMEDALADPGLWSAIKCCIYTAIQPDGKITSANFTTMLACIGAISYSEADVVATIHDYLQKLGWHALAGYAQAAALTTGDCSGCGGWCREFDFTVSQAGWNVVAGNGGYTGGAAGFESLPGGGIDHLTIEYVGGFGPAVLTSIEVFGNSTGSSAAAGYREVYVYISGVQTAYGFLPTVAGTTDTVLPGTVTADGIAMTYGNNPQTGTCHITKVIVRGTGTQPFTSGTSC
jgi:hypothetical protein